MASYDFTRLKRLTIIYNVVQVGLLGLLLFMAYNFMLAFAKYGMSGLFVKSFIMAVAVQLICMYPAWWLAGKDVEVEVETSLVGVTPEQLVALRRRRLLGVSGRSLPWAPLWSLFSCHPVWIRGVGHH